MQVSPEPSGGAEGGHEEGAGAGPKHRAHLVLYLRGLWCVLLPGRPLHPDGRPGAGQCPRGRWSLSCCVLGVGVS